MNAPRKYKLLLIAPLVAIAAAAALGLFTWAVMALWNGVAVAVLGVRIVSFWQALGLLVLAKLLFGGVGGRRWGGPMGMGRWRNMSPEDREKMREEMRARFGDMGGPGWCRAGEGRAPEPPSQG